MFTLRDVLNVAIKLEVNGERLYRDAARNVRDPELTSLLVHLADEEAAHVKWFEERLEGVNRTGVDADSALARMSENMLLNVVGDQCLSLDDVDFDSVESVIEVLDAAFDLENDTVDFYEMIAGFVNEPKVIEQLNEIIKEEMEHALALAEHVKKTRVSPPVTS